MNTKLRRLATSESRRAHLQNYGHEEDTIVTASLIDLPDRHHDSNNANSNMTKTVKVPKAYSSEFTSYFSKGRNQNLHRESQSPMSVFIFVLIYVGLDAWRQVTSYGMTYYNGGKYPMSHTWIVAVTESLKFFIFFSILIAEGNVKKARPSLWFAIPAIIYGVNNNIYFMALYFTTPPMWNIFTQQRLVLTALTYRLLFKRPVSRTQWIALVMLLMTIIMSQFSGGQKSGSLVDMIMAVVFAFFVSTTSVVASFVMEYSFKNDSRSFSEMQAQLYFYSTASSWGFYFIEQQPTLVLEGEKSMLLSLVVLSVLLSCCTGFTVAVMVKKLDSIVKLYTQALANMFTSLACAIFFPRDFYLSFNFVLCLIVMVLAVVTYEGNGLPVINVFHLLHSRYWRGKTNSLLKGP